MSTSAPPAPGAEAGAQVELYTASAASKALRSISVNVGAASTFSAMERTWALPAESLTCSTSYCRASVRSFCTALRRSACATIATQRDKPTMQT